MVSISECTLCGKNVNKLFLAEVEGSKIEICESCGKFGNLIEEVKPKEQKAEGLFLKKAPELEENQEEMKSDYGKLIIQARKKMGLERKDFAMKINEKESIIKRIESQEMVPDEKLQKKIEGFLEIKLSEAYEKARLNNQPNKENLTLGDIAKIE